MTDLEIANGLPEIPEEDWREAIIKRRHGEGFTPSGFIIEPDVHTARTNETWGAIYEYEGQSSYATPEDEALAIATKAFIVKAAEVYGRGNVALELVPPAFEEDARQLCPSTYPLKNYRIVMVRISKKEPEIEVVYIKSSW